MLNLYKYYEEPKELLDYGSNHHFKMALRTFIGRPDDLSEMDRQLLMSHKDVLKETHSAELLCKFAQFVMQDRWPEAEQIIKEDPHWAAKYVLNVINRDEPKPPIRWEEAEDSIMKDPWGAYRYATDILRKKWPEAEYWIRKDFVWWNQYQLSF